MRSIEVPPDTRSVKTARVFVVECLPDVLEDVLDTVTLLVSELVTNAVLHAKSTVVIAVTSTAHLVRVEVSDESDRKAKVRDYGHHATTGRGMGLVEALAARWGVVPTPPGKTVWFEVVT